MRLKLFFLTFLLAFAVTPSKAAGLLDRTLRVDYIFSGTDQTAEIAVDALYSFDGWAGRHVHRDEVPLRGNGEVRRTDAASGAVLYRHTFSTLFQEWQATEEATRVRKSFENVFLLPMPSSKVEITVELYDFFGQVAASLTHPVDPSDILIRPIGQEPAPTRDILRSGSSRDCIDIVILPEGYTEDEMDLVYADAQAAWESFLTHDVFRRMASRFNVTAVMIPSAQTGVSIPKQGLWRETAFQSHFDTFYSDRYLTTLRLSALHDHLAGLPYEHIIILANTANYGGGGIYNSYELTAAHHPIFRPVVVHEFGHSFAGLADEYFYDDQYVEMYYPEAEPWEKNITTMKDFDAKWKDMMGQDGVGLFEGGGYQSRGVWRASKDCRMQTNTYPDFCPVCARAIEEMIRFYTEE